MAQRTSPPTLLLSNTGRTFPSLAGTPEAQLFGVGVKWLMGKGQSRDIFGTKTSSHPPTSPHNGNVQADHKSGVAFAHRGSWPMPPEPGA